MKTMLRKPVSPLIKIGFIGDFVPGHPSHQPINTSQDILELMDSCDFIVANLESPLTDELSWKPKGHGASLRSEPASVVELKRLNIGLANLANNHILDCGVIGLEDTIDALKKNGIAWFGAGKKREQASKPYFLENLGIKIGFLAYTFNPQDFLSMPSEENAGPNLFELVRVKKQVAELKKKGFIICVSYHGGWELFRVPCKVRRDVLREIARSGADLVVGHHAHLFQGIEYIDNNLILYGLGNYYFRMLDRNKVPYKGTNIGLFAIVEMDREGPVSYRPYFVYTSKNDHSLSLIQGRNELNLRKMLHDLSEIISSDKKHMREWRYDCCRKALNLNSSLNSIQLLNYYILKLYRKFKENKYIRLLSRTKPLKLNNNINNKMIKYIYSRKVSPEYVNPYRDIIRAIIWGMPRAIFNLRHTTKWYRVYNLKD